jgi:hypothetical protein
MSILEVARCVEQLLFWQMIALSCCNGITDFLSMFTESTVATYALSQLKSSLISIVQFDSVLSCTLRSRARGSVVV